MATELTTVFVPIIAEPRMAAYVAGDLQTAARQSDPGVDLRFTPLEEGDKAIFMVAPGEVFFVSAGTTVVLNNGPQVVAPPDRNAVVIHVLSTFEWSPILATTGQPVPEWWAFEGITTDSFETFLNTYNLGALAHARGYADDVALRTAILAGAASLNALLLDEQPAVLGSLSSAADATVTLGVRAFAHYDTGIVELDARTALATISQVAPGIAGHPLLAQVLADITALPVTIHIRFKYWSPKRTNATSETDKGLFKAVDNGSKISLQKRSAAAVYTTIVEATVTRNGQVALNVPRAELNAINLAGGESLVVGLKVPAGKLFETQYQHDKTPRKNDTALTWGTASDTWSTEGRFTTDDAIENLNFLVSLASTTVGTLEQPLEYYAGVPIFVQIKYPVVYVAGSGATATFKQEIRPAPKGLLVRMASTIALGDFRTDEHGQIWGMLMRWDPQRANVTAEVVYDIEDGSIGLLPIQGEVVDRGLPAANSYLYGFQNPVTSSLGQPSSGPVATALAAVQVGTVEIGGAAVSEFSSINGRDAAMMHALHQIRYIHQWFHYLTQGYRDGATDRSWDAILAEHNRGRGTANGGAIQFDVLLPKVRVSWSKNFVDPTTGNTVIDETINGEADFDINDAPNLRWWLTLYGHDTFKMNQQLMVQDKNGVITHHAIPQLENKAQAWRVHTIWHEFTHAIVNMALGRLFDLDKHQSMTLAKDPSTSSRVHQVILDSVDPAGNLLSGGWSVLEEALAALPEAALMERASGEQPTFVPAAPAAPRHMLVDIDAAGNADTILTPATDLNLSQGLLVDLNRAVGPPLFDQRLGLRVPIAFTWALWTALKDVGGFNGTLDAHVNQQPLPNDLKDVAVYLTAAKARTVFQALVWGPLFASRTPDIPAVPPQWNDLSGPVNGPTTFSFMTIIETRFWNRLSAADRAAIKELFGDADNPVSYYLWFTFP